jgi:DNA-binding HxlR family transcriptional regulator
METKGLPWHADDPQVDALVHELIGAVADKWTMIVLETLDERGELRFTQIAKSIPGISQKMVTRTVHAVVPPRVDYRLTPLGRSLGEAFCGVWTWAEANLAAVAAARAEFDGRDA